MKSPKAKRAKGVGSRALSVTVDVAVVNTVAKTVVAKAATKKAIDKVKHTVNIANGIQGELDEIVVDEIMVESLPESDLTIPDAGVGYPIEGGILSDAAFSNDRVLDILIETNRNLSEEELLDLNNPNDEDLMEISVLSEEELIENK